MSTIKKEIKNKNDASPCLIDAYCGVGGMSLGAARAGFKVALGIEIDSNISAAHERNFPHTKHLNEDILQHNGASLLQTAGLKLGELAGFVGGPPCQGFSHIGQRDKSDPRNRLFIHFFRLISELRPDFFVAENVPGILDGSHQATLAKAFEFVEDYTVLPPMRLKASKYGAPTKRERVFFIGFKKQSIEAPTVADFDPSSEIIEIKVGTALKGLPTTIKNNWATEDQGWRVRRKHEAGHFWERINGFIPNNVGDEESIRRLEEEQRVSGCLGTVHADKIALRYGLLEGGMQDHVSKSVRLKLDDFCPTLRAGTGSDRGSYQAVRPIHPSEPRVITPREAARLQGFPDWFRFAPSKWHSFRMIGNSVSPFVSEAVLKTIYSKLYANTVSRLEPAAIAA